MIKRINHMAIVAPDLDAATGFWAEALGLPVTRIEDVPAEGVRVAFLPVGESNIELLQPTDAESGVARYLEKRGPGMHHLCLEVDDIVLQIGYEQVGELFDMFGVPRAGGRGAPVIDPVTMRVSDDVYVVGTATAGTQDRFEIFIENSHDHPQRVAAALAGRPAPSPRRARPIPEV